MPAAAGARGRIPAAGRSPVTVTTGRLPAWAGELTDESLRRRFDAGTLARGTAYARAGAVVSLSAGDHGKMLLGSVRGHERSSYQTLVRRTEPAGEEPAGLSGRCSCPVQTDCKHVVAVLLTARDRAGRSAVDGPAGPAAWEAQLADLVRQDAPATTELALQVDPVTPRAGRSAGVRFRLRPAVPGRTGWVTAGVSWRGIEGGGYGQLSYRPEQREGMLGLLALYRSHRAGYLTPYSEPQLHLDDLGPGVWRVLRDLRERGVPLVGGGRSAPAVELLPPARATVDVRRDGSPDAVLGVALTLADGSALPPEAGLVGDPAHGITLVTPGRLHLAPLDRPLDPATQRLQRQGGLRIPDGDLPRFLEVYYPALRRRLPVVSTDGSVAFPQVQPPRLLLDVEFAPGHVTTLRWAFGYPVDDRLVRVPLAGGPGGAARDPVAEEELLGGLTALDAVPGLRTEVGGVRRPLAEARLTGLATATFAEQILPRLRGRDDLEIHVEGEPADYVETDAPPVVSVGTGDRHDPDHPDWFDLEVSVTVGGQQVPFAPLFTALARGQDHLILDSGTWFRLDRPELAALRRLIEEARSLQDRPGDPLRVTPFQAGLWEDLVDLGVVTHTSERWTRSVGALVDAAERPQPPAPAGLRAQLRPYQLAGYQWLALLWDLHLGGVLADDMGLGKTLQTLAMVARARERGDLAAGGPVLIVAPTSVVGTWPAEAARFCPDLRVTALTGTEKRTGRAVADAAAGADLVVTSYALLRMDDEAYQATRWSGLVLDEAQFVKNHRAKTYQSARRLAAPFTLAITGTPLENSLMDLWSMLSLAAPGLFPDPARFTERYRKPIESGEAPDQLDALRRRVRPFMLRRTKAQVAADLPPKIEQTIEVTLNPAHRRVYDTYLHRERQRVLKLVDDLPRNRLAILSSLTVLRQLSLAAALVDERHADETRSSKIDVLVDRLHEVAGEGHRALVFSQFTGFLSLVRSRLAAEGLVYTYLDGRTRDRDRRIAEFRQGDAPVFLISLKAGGFGLTLTEADYVFVLDPWWNPAAEQQAIDRAHRIGQDKTVMVYRMVAADTIEEKVVALQQRKRDLFARVVDGGGAVEGQLTAADIRGLFED